MRHDIDAGDGAGALQPAGNQALSAQAAALVAREANSVQGAIISARRFPRDQGMALQRVEAACARIKLAEQAMYSYTRGGQEITGPSIRLAEVLGQNWGNLDFGFKEVERRNGESVVVSYCWDLETNVRRGVEFIVPHVRETKKGSYTITSERDIYELMANQAQRRVRSSILSVIPGDVVEAAIEACERTLSQAGDIEQRRANLVKSFAELDVTADMIERRLGKKISSISQVDFVQLRKIYQSLKDEMSQVADWFEAVHEPEKIKRAIADGGQALATPADKANDEAERRVAIAEFQKGIEHVLRLKGDVESIIGAKVSDVRATWAIDGIFAAADRLLGYKP